ncbi:transposase [Kitasatospora sp. NPDC101447]|uniref:transposase n=1 Tax=Kitasatospora sp. NPDC101447 TaxID=3364102 RepID=UPI0037F95C74
MALAVFLMVAKLSGDDLMSLAARLVPDVLWEAFGKVVRPAEVVRPQGGGRRRAGDREVLAAIVFVATVGCTWRELPRLFGPSWQTVYRRFAQWSRAGVWERLGRIASEELGESGDAEWVRHVADTIGGRWGCGRPKETGFESNGQPERVSCPNPR